MRKYTRTDLHVRLRDIRSGVSAQNALFSPKLKVSSGTVPGKEDRWMRDGLELSNCPSLLGHIRFQ